MAYLEYTVTSTKISLKKIKNVKVSDSHQLLSFDVKSLFPNVPLEKSIDIILKRICENKETNTSISIKDIKNMLVLCRRRVDLSMNGEIYLQMEWR